jgi:excisionase family DNA binding protein
MDNCDKQQLPIANRGLIRMSTASSEKPNTPSFLTVAEAAKELQISERSLRTLISIGEVGATRLSKKIVRIPRAEMARLATHPSLVRGNQE